MGDPIMRATTAELLLYAGASAAALVLDVAVLTALVERAGWPYLAAAASSFIAGGVFLYVLSVRFVFPLRRIGNPVVELPLFVALGLAGLVVNTAVMFAAVEAVHVHYLIAKAGAAACTFTTNFLLRRNLMFSRPMQSP